MCGVELGEGGRGTGGDGGGAGGGGGGRGEEKGRAECRGVLVVGALVAVGHGGGRRRRTARISLTCCLIAIYTTSTAPSRTLSSSSPALAQHPRTPQSLSADPLSRSHDELVLS